MARDQIIRGKLGLKAKIANSGNKYQGKITGETIKGIAITACNDAINES